jgi:hypothetical protein
MWDQFMARPVTYSLLSCTVFWEPCSPLQQITILFCYLLLPSFSALMPFSTSSICLSLDLSIFYLPSGFPSKMFLATIVWSVWIVCLNHSKLLFSISAISSRILYKSFNSWLASSDSSNPFLGHRSLTTFHSHTWKLLCMFHFHIIFTGLGLKYALNDGEINWRLNKTQDWNT